MHDDARAAFGDSSYRENDRWSDLGEVRAPMILFALAASCFAFTLFVYYRPLSDAPLAGRVLGEDTFVSVTTAVGGLATLLTFVLSILGIGAGVYVASENRHRHQVHRLALAFTALSAANLVAFIVFAVLTASS